MIILVLKNGKRLWIDGDSVTTVEIYEIIEQLVKTWGFSIIKKVEAKNIKKYSL